ncbi:MAG: hypothetical protein ACRC7N_16555 [Clostridium sp.]
MKNYILLELKRILNCRKYKGIVMLLFMFVISAFIYTCKNNYGEYLSYVHSASEMGIIQGIPSGYAMNTLVILLPIIASILYADSYHKEYNNGVSKIIQTKISKRNYFLSKIIVNIIIVFCTIFSLVALNEVLTFIAFPKNGYFNNAGVAAYTYEYNREFFIDMLRITNPYLYNTIIIAIYALFGALISTLTLVITFVSKSKWIVNLFITFIPYIILMIIGHLFNMQKFSFTSYIEPVRFGDIYSLMVLITFTSILVISIYRYSLVNDSFL